MRWPLIGREHELDAIVRALLGSAGVVVTGPAGIGKTRLVAEAAERLPAGCEVAWIRATRSAAAVPLGAFAPLLAASDVAAQGVELLARARRSLVERAGERRLVLVVDDAHLLDGPSAALLHQLVAGGEAVAAVTVRRDEAVPDAVRALTKDAGCSGLEVGALGRDDVAALLEGALGAPVAGTTVAALWTLTRGNALFLRQLVTNGLGSGALARGDETWRWHGAIAAGTDLAALVERRVEALPARAGELLALVAVGGPLEVALLPPDAGGALERLERDELVEVRGDGRRRSADVAHPLYGEAVRQRLTRTHLHQLHTRLADAVTVVGARRGGDLLRVASWRLESGAVGDGKLLARASARALAAADPPLAERLARAAARAGAGEQAQLALGRSLAASGDGAGAERVLAALAPATDEDRAAVALARARNLFWALHRPADADAVLRDAEAAIAMAGLRHELAAQRARMTAADGRPEAALAAARSLLDDPAVREGARVTAALGAVEAQLQSGAADAAVALAEAWLPVAARRADALPSAEAVLLGMHGVALRLSGRLVEATTRSEAAYGRLVERRLGAATAVEAVCLGLAWLARGRVRTALRFTRESVALLRDSDPVGMRALALAAVAQAAAQAGEAEAAEVAVAQMDGVALGHHAFLPEIELARAWGAAAAGELSRAAALAREAAGHAQARGQHAYAVGALHLLARLGRPSEAAGGLAALAPRVDGPSVVNAAAHAGALAARDPVALLATAEALAGHGAVLIAAEAAFAAEGLHRDAGRAASARAAAARAGLWLAACEGARPPTLPPAAEAADLTGREREIALLAARGATSADIAGRLVVSVRTVDNHLQSAYRKLGVTRRRDLAAALAAPQ